MLKKCSLVRRKEVMRKGRDPPVFTVSIVWKPSVSLTKETISTSLLMTSSPPTLSASIHLHLSSYPLLLPLFCLQSFISPPFYFF